MVHFHNKECHFKGGVCDSGDQLQGSGSSNSLTAGTSTDSTEVVPYSEIEEGISSNEQDSFTISDNISFDEPTLQVM